MGNNSKLGRVNIDASRRLEAAANGGDPNEKPVENVRIGHDKARSLVALDLGDGPRMMHPLLALQVIEGLSKAVRNTIVQTSKRVD